MFKISTKKDAIADTQGSSYIAKSGIYDVDIKFVSQEETKNGAIQFNFTIEHNGNQQTIWGPIVQKKDGTPNEIGLLLVNKLGIIAGMTDGDELEFSETTHKVGKDQKEMEFVTIDQFDDLPIKIRLQEVYSQYNGTIRKAMDIRGVYRQADGASAQEIVDETGYGDQLAKDEAYASNVTYNDGLTEEDIVAWRESKASGASTPKTAPKIKAKPAGGLFKK